MSKTYTDEQRYRAMREYVLLEHKNPERYLVVEEKLSRYEETITGDITEKSLDEYADHLIGILAE